MAPECFKVFVEIAENCISEVGKKTGPFSVRAGSFTSLKIFPAYLVNNIIPLNYTLIPSYAAPEQVYRTARMMGPNVYCDVILSGIEVFRMKRSLCMTTWLMGHRENTFTTPKIPHYHGSKGSRHVLVLHLNYNITCTEVPTTPSFIEKSDVYSFGVVLFEGGEVNGNDENHANESSAVGYHVLFTSGSGSIRVGR
ncbi:hypothetical protein V6N11_023841 [Hibiscus sabdariffa]|uniref:Uncharacterized protein n=1 Tax=Hibiscus sabdariffa TaxID=183260 RepID=A0ABR2TNE7_9ROSI